MVEYKSAKSSVAKPSDGSYWIVPPGGTKKVRYRRVSKFIDVIPDDNDFLAMRDKRYAAIGIAKNPKLAEQIADLDPENKDDKREIYQVAERGARAEGRDYKAWYGTVIHAVTEDHDAGHNVFTARPPDTPAVSELKWGEKNVLMEDWKSLKKDARAYALLLEAYQITFSKVEATVVLDEYKVCGTLDRLMEIGRYFDITPPEDGNDTSVGDVKSGSLDFGAKKMPMQFRSYAGGLLYNHDTHERREHGASLTRAYVIHLPAKEVTPTLVPLDLSQAARNLERAHAIWQAKAEEDINEWKKYGVDDWLKQEIANTGTRAELDSLYERAHVLWTDEHTALAQEQVKTHGTAS